jgi:hypothetical protein
MIRHVITACGLLFCATVCAQSATDAAKVKNIGTIQTDPKVEAQCGMSMRTPNLQHVSDQAITFGCTGSYINGNTAVMEMDFQYDQNFDNRGGDNIGFMIEGIGISQKMAAGGDSIFRMEDTKLLPTLTKSAANSGSNCGPIVNTKVTRIKGSNWHGWIAEQTFGKDNPRCRENDKEYTSNYRCVQAMIGNNKMTAQLSRVCLLRKRQLSLENGFSYDLFIDMLKTLRFKEE